MKMLCGPTANSRKTKKAICVKFLKGFDAMALIQVQYLELVIESKKNEGKPG